VQAVRQVPGHDLLLNIQMKGRHTGSPARRHLLMPS
jgi:hypothetical protein